MAISCRSKPEPTLFETEIPFALTPPPSDRRSYDKVTRLCPRCGRELTDKAYFKSNCFRGTCGKNKKP